MPVSPNRRGARRWPCHPCAMGPSHSAKPRPRQRARRSDALENQEKILVAAVAAIRRQGHHVPLYTIAADAGVGTATLYRSYPDRGALLLALTRRAYDLLIDQLDRAVQRDEHALVSLERFLDWQIEHRDELVLPLQGGPIVLDAESYAQRQRISDSLTVILQRGQRDGTVRHEATSIDVVIFSALITQPLPNAPDWDVVAHRQKRLFLDGIAATGTPALPAAAPTMADIEANFRARR